MSDRTRVLICDDEAQILRALRVILGDAGFEVVPATTARRRSTPPRCVRREAAIIDLVLPDGDGVDVCRSIREWSEMPILVLSAVGRRAREGARARGRRRRLRDQAVRARRAGRASARGAAPGRAGGRARSRCCAPARSRSTSPAHRVTQERGGGPPDADGVRAAAAAGPQPRPPADPPGAAARRSGARATRTTPRCCACTSPTCAARSSPSRASRASSAPIPASATASPLSRLHSFFIARRKSLRSLDANRVSLCGVELRQTTPHPMLLRRPSRAATHSRRRRLHARLSSWRLDHELASGVDPRTDPVLACRAEQLVTADTRQRLAEALRDSLAEATFGSHLGEHRAARRCEHSRPQRTIARARGASGILHEVNPPVLRSPGSCWSTAPLRRPPRKAAGARPGPSSKP